MAESINHRAIRWLRSQLPELVAGRVISAESAAAIERHYASAEARSTHFGFVILAAIGSALVGAGIILLIAHNWDELSRSIRCIIAFLPLVLAQVLGFFVLLKRNDSAAWRESVALLDVAAVGTAISLVSQIFQISGSFEDFLRVWLLLSIPIVYLFRADFAALAYVLGSAVWVVSKAGWIFNRPGEMFFWVLLLLIIPFYIGLLRKGQEGWLFRALSLVLVAAGSIGLGLTVDFSNCDVGGIAFAGFFAAIYLAGMRWQEDADRSLNVLSTLGGIGIAATAITLSFKAIWHLRTGFSWSDFGLEQRTALGIALFFPTAAIALAVWTWARRRIFYSLMATAIPVVAIIARSTAALAPKIDQSVDNPYGFVASILFNLYALGLGIEFLIRGIRADSITRANFGLLVIAALAVARFFDSDLSFVVRGVGFIAVGAGFLVANMLFFRKRLRA